MRYKLESLKGTLELALDETGNQSVKTAIKQVDKLLEPFNLNPSGEDKNKCMHRKECWMRDDQGCYKCSDYKETE